MPRKLKTAHHSNSVWMC